MLLRRLAQRGTRPLRDRRPAQPGSEANLTCRSCRYGADDGNRTRVFSLGSRSGMSTSCMPRFAADQQAEGETPTSAIRPPTIVV